MFRPDHPVFEVQFAREHRLKLEVLIEGLPLEVFTATDSLGWVYQFWQTKKKDEVNRSEVKIGADELSSVTQLFTEPYMVQFLLHNSLGGWWLSRHPDKTCTVDLAYLRRAEDGVPAAGAFDNWPDDLSEFRLLDPCCGSGHFLVAAFLILVPMRMALEGLDAAQAVDAVLRENLYGLELDQRCVAIAAFALALEAWRFPDAGGYRTLPKLNLAWCGQPVAGKKEQWLALAEGDARLEAGMAALYDTFRDAPTLGSLIDPARSVSEDMLTAGFEELQPLLEKALREHAGEEEWKETAIAALGLAEATRLLSGHYHLVITNVPYLARGKQNERLRKFSETRYPTAKNDLANVFLERCLEFSQDEGVGITQIVMPQNWLFLTSYKAQREHLLRDVRWDLLARLGAGAFETIGGEVVNVILLTMGSVRPHVDHRLRGIDASKPRTVLEKAERLQNNPILTIGQRDQLGHPDARISLEVLEAGQRLSDYADSFLGLGTGDFDRFGRRFWEFDQRPEKWSFLQSAAQTVSDFDGLSLLVSWDPVENRVFGMDRAHRERIHNQDQSGQQAWGSTGIGVALMSLRTSVYLKTRYDKSMAAIVPRNSTHAPAIYAFCKSPDFHDRVREIDHNVIVANGTLVKVPFDLDYWMKIASEKYPNGLPKSQSDDPTHWVFHGNPSSSSSSLQVVVARLLGYRWPPERDPGMDLAEEQGAWVKKARTLHPFEDEDGIVCIPSVRGERSAQERMLQLLQVAYDDWNDDILIKLLAESGSKSLDDWLRNKFFDEHCKLFQHRPFIWHIWDGRKRDGFHALVNYHKLAEGDGKGRRLLESLTYSYLGDWIARQKDGVKRGEGGAEDRLAAALELQKRLIAIIEGEPPFDLFVRWKPIEEQPIGWEPDINDGVRLNIRPFMVQDLPGGKKGAGILRAKPNIHWKKDRGKEPTRDQAQFPWFWKAGKFTGERVNDVHLTITEKRAARAQGGS
ncbi:MAG: DNA methyltransferase [Candidatus Thiodiazotropha endolucinida]